jgi:pilus assembly protein Flp/PilA
MSKLLAARSWAAATVKKFLTRKEEGASMVEYGLLVALIAVVCIAGVTVVGTKANAVFQSAANSLTAAS